MEYLRKLECGCELFTSTNHEPDIVFCPMHKSAPDMYEALKNLRHTVDELIQSGTIPLDHPDIVKITMQNNESLWAMNKALGC